MRVMGIGQYDIRGMYSVGLVKLGSWYGLKMFDGVLMTAGTDKILYLEQTQPPETKLVVR